jgi:hypothetical protein
MTWRIHNDADISQITAPPRGTEDETCSDALHGQAAWSASVPSDADPESLRPCDTSPAYQPVNYGVWKAPSGATGGSFQDPGDGNEVLYRLPDQTALPTQFIMQFTTLRRVSVPAQLVFPPASPTTANLYLYSLTDFTATFPAGSVARGDTLGVKPLSGGSTFIELTVVDCSHPPLSVPAYGSTAGQVSSPGAPVTATEPNTTVCH